jgi:hypothetical protein
LLSFKTVDYSFTFTIKLVFSSFINKKVNWLVFQRKKCITTMKLWKLSLVQYCRINPIFFFLLHTGVWTQGLARQVLYHLNHASSPFCLKYFSNKVSNLCPGRPGLPAAYSCFPSSQNDRCTTIPSFYRLRWDFFFFLLHPGWPGT